MDNTTDMFLIPLLLLVAVIIVFQTLKIKLSSLAKPDTESVLAKFVELACSRIRLMKIEVNGKKD
ncbi:hypothetical protein [Neptunomonas antarctica]|uniref:Uncharacterized protein n=1 Tax=Neptunomonas antarctica TaxID=619304 RepID=A0A1N7P9E0_9GAMM|nr:hypothetical protein [Neptunomonas antarctica]SIT07255.1 hypothetical protein SAMN05421760_11366 [Neptunomonas antarctica]